MNIDKKEIDNFDIYAHEWWNKRGPYKLIHNLTPIRVDYIQNTINIKGLRILDIGCGGGLLAEELSKKGAKITGLDASEKTINIAKQHAKESNLNIEWIYEGVVDTHSVLGSVKASVVSQPPLQHIEELKKLGQIGHIRGIQSKLDELENDFPDCIVFFATLRSFVNDFHLSDYMAELEDTHE